MREVLAPRYTPEWTLSRDLEPSLERGIELAQSLAGRVGVDDAGELDLILAEYEEVELAIEEAMPPPPNQQGWQGPVT